MGYTRTCSTCRQPLPYHVGGCPESEGQYATLYESEAAVRTCRHPKPRYGPCPTCDEAAS